MIAITANKRPSGLIHLVDGDQSVIEFRWAEGNYQRLPGA